MNARPKYRRDNSAPPAGPKIRIHRLKASERDNFEICGTAIHGFWTHWGTRTEPCTEPRDQCEGCLKQWPQRWKGYIYCIRQSRMEDGFLEVTPLLRDKLLSYVTTPEQLRGKRFLVQRGKGDKSTLAILPLRDWYAEHPGEEMPAEVDPEETLHALFSFRRAKAVPQ